MILDTIKMPESEEIIIMPRQFNFSFFSLMYYVSVILNEATNKYSLSVKVHDSNDEEVLFWRNLNLQHFEVLHMMTRIFLLLPDKLATALEIQFEDLPEDSGSFLLELVAKLFEDALVKANTNNFPNSFVADMTDLYEELIDIISSFDNRTINLHQIKEFLVVCQPNYNVAKIYADCGHAQLIHLNRFGRFSPKLYESLENVLDKIRDKDLLSEFKELSGDLEHDE